MQGYVDEKKQQERNQYIVFRALEICTSLDKEVSGTGGAMHMAREHLDISRCLLVVYHVQNDGAAGSCPKFIKVYLEIRTVRTVSNIDMFYLLVS